jgi:hypothetical protein
MGNLRVGTRERDRALPAQHETQDRAEQGGNAVNRRIRSGLVAATLVFSATALGACAALKDDGVDDDRLARNVMAELRDARNLDVHRINVQASDGLVQLSGFVDSDDDKERAEEIAEDVRGVEEVENDLIVD